MDFFARQDQARKIITRAVAGFALAFLASCATRNDDSRLQGTWRSNRDETVAAALQQAPSWRNAPPEKLERLRETFGHMIVTYSNGVAITQLDGKEDAVRYNVVQRGEGFVIIRLKEGIEKDHDTRIEFVDNGNGYWVVSFLGDTFMGKGFKEKFDRVVGEQGNK